MRWLTPPPTRTAYFCAMRRPGIVLRVSRIRARADAQAGDRLARVEDPRARAAHRGHVIRRDRRGPAERLQEIERGAFGRHERPRAAFERGDHRAGADAIPFGDMPGDGDLGI
jgi:hypothetical protein